jgi:hypothetical protein
MLLELAVLLAIQFVIQVLGKKGLYVFARHNDYIS